MVTMETPDVAGMGPAVQALRDWQDDSIPLQLHPGDIGWYWRHGPEATARALRIWRRGDRIVAIAQLDGPDLLRVTTAPELARDEELARVLARDVADPASGVLPGGGGSIEAPQGLLLRDLLLATGWTLGMESTESPSPWA